jgi:hypothetical protein
MPTIRGGVESMLLARGMSREGELSQRAIAVAWQRDCRSCLNAAAPIRPARLLAALL